MDSNSSLPKAAGSIPVSEVIDVDLEEPNTQSKVCTNETSSGRDCDLATGREDGSENEKKQYVPDGQKSNNSTRNEQMAQQEKSNSTKDVLVDDEGWNNTVSSKRQRIKLEDVRNFDILLPNQKNCTGVRKAKKSFYDGFVWYRKLVDRVRPAFMKCNTIEEKSKVTKWLIEKAKERGGRFLKENGDGKSDVCRVMTMQDTLKYTMGAFEDVKSWTTIASFLDGNSESDPPFAKQSHEIDLDGNLKPKTLDQQSIKKDTAPSFPQPQTLSNDSLEAEMSNSEHESFAKAKTAISNNFHISAEPPAKKPKIIATADMLLGSTLSLNPGVNPVHNTSEKALNSAETLKSSLALQTCLMERQMIREELIENQEILVMRKGRASRLEAEFRLFHNRQLVLPSEQWLTEKILRQEELFENRELLGIQQQRCRRLQTLMDLNERQVFDHQSSIEREKLEKVLNTISASQSAQTKILIETDLIVNNSNNSNNVNTMIKGIREKKIQQELVSQQMIDQQVALEAEMNRRVDQKKAMEQEIEYRVEMEHAVRRQVEMQKSMQARQLMMARAGLSHDSPEIPAQGPPQIIENVRNASPDFAKSIGKADDTKKENDESESEIIIGSDQGISVTEWEFDKSNVEETDDEDFIII